MITSDTISGKCPASAGTALPAALFLTAMLALVGAALHLAVQTELQLAINCLESDRARFAAGAALRRQSAQMRQALARFRLPPGLTDIDVERYRDDLLSGSPDRRLSLLEDGVPGLLARYGPWTLDLPLDGAPLEPLDQWACCRAACHLEPLGVSGSPDTGLLFSYRCRVTGEGGSNAPGRRAAAFCREESLFTIALARFPRSHWQLCLPVGDGQASDRRLLLPALVYAGPVRTKGRPGFAGTGRPLSGLPWFTAAFLTPRDNPASWSLEASADPRFAGGRACLADPFPALPPPGNLARASLGLLPGPGPLLDVEELREALGLPSGTGRPPPGVYLFRNGELTGGIYVEGDLASLVIRGEGDQQVLILEPAGGAGNLEIRVDALQQITVVDGVVFPDVVDGPLFVEGAIHAIDAGAVPGGPVPPVVAPDVALTVAASGDITVRGHLVYTASPGPLPDPRNTPPPDGRMLGLYSAGHRADGFPAAGQGILFDGPAGRLRLDAALAVGGVERGVRAGEGTAVDLFGALTVDDLVQRELLSWCSVTYDRRFASSGFCPPGWPSGPSFEAYLASWEVLRLEEISPYQ